MRDFERLGVWERSHRLTLAIYEATMNFSREELYGLTSQLRRSCAPIPANVAEGCGRGSNADLGCFLQIASGSASELEYHLLLARELSFLKPHDYERLTGEVTAVKRMLTSFNKCLRTFANVPDPKADA